MAATAYGKAKVGSGFTPPVIDDGTYLATLKSVRDKEGEWEGESYDQYLVEWELDEVENADGSPITLGQFVRIPDGLHEDPPILNENSNLYRLLEGLGYDMDDVEIDPVQWPGKKARITVRNEKVKQGRNAGQSRPKIKDVLPAASKTGSTAVRKREPKPEDDF